jgi:CFEM domain
MLGMFSELGCSSESDINCLCSKDNFSYGVRDCTNESCPGADRAAVFDLFNQICKSACASP